VGATGEDGGYRDGDRGRVDAQRDARIASGPKHARTVTSATGPRPRPSRGRPLGCSKRTQTFARHPRQPVSLGHADRIILAHPVLSGPSAGASAILGLFDRGVSMR